MLTPEWVGRRGCRDDRALEYVDGETGDGKGGGFGSCPATARCRTAPTDFFSDNRWAYWLRHQQELVLGRAVRHRRDEISDNDIVFDFPTLLGTRHPAPAHGRVGGLADRRAERLCRERARLGEQRHPEPERPRPRRLLPAAAARTCARRRCRARSSAFRSRRASRPATRTSCQFGANHTQVFGLPPVNGQFFDTGADGRFTYGEPDATAGSATRTTRIRSTRTTRTRRTR